MERLGALFMGGLELEEVEAYLFGGAADPGWFDIITRGGLGLASDPLLR